MAENKKEITKEYVNNLTDEEIQYLEFEQQEERISNSINFTDIEFYCKPTTGQWLKALRILCGHEQKELADAVGVKQGAISKWELNLSTPDTKNIDSLAYALHIDIPTLLLILGYTRAK